MLEAHMIMSRLKFNIYADLGLIAGYFLRVQFHAISVLPAPTEILSLSTVVVGQSSSSMRLD